MQPRPSRGNHVRCIHSPTRPWRARDTLTHNRRLLPPFVPPPQMADNFSYCHENAIPFMVLFGEEEVKAGVVKIKVGAGAWSTWG